MGMTFFSRSRKIARGHEVTLVKVMINVNWISGSTRSHKGH